MAKWGEGDPRWIVEERPDATNVNNWHWTEKNASVWSKEKFKKLFTELCFNNALFDTCEIQEVTSIDGDASASNRKAKLIFFYEWVIKMAWKAKKGDKTAKGTLEIPNMSEENEPHEVDVIVSVDSGGEFGDQVKEYLLKSGIKNIQQCLAEYLKCLKEEFSKDMILPKKGESIDIKSPTADTVANTVKHKNLRNLSDVTENTKKLDIGVKLVLQTISSKQSFKCTADEIYRILTVAEMVQAFTQGPVKFHCSIGGKFELFGGQIMGEFVELVENKKIVQKWRTKDWPSGHYSTVTFVIEQQRDFSELKLTQTGVPKSEYEKINEGWTRYYWDPIRRVFGLGTFLH